MGKISGPKCWRRGSSMPSEHLLRVCCLSIYRGRFCAGLLIVEREAARSPQGLSCTQLLLRPPTPAAVSFVLGAVNYTIWESQVISGVYSMAWRANSLPKESLPSWAHRPQCLMAITDRVPGRIAPRLVCLLFLK